MSKRLLFFSFILITVVASGLASTVFAADVQRTVSASATLLSGELPTREVITLNGTWQLQPGETEPGSYNYTVPVPGLVDLAQPTLDWQSYNYHWYKKTFILNSSQAHTHASIKIDQSKYGTQVWLNGTYLGNYIGCYTSHQYQADSAINYDGENTLLVKVGAKDTLPPESAVGNDLEKVSFIPGIWGDISLILTENPIIERVQLIPFIDTNIAQAKVTLKNLEGSGQDIVLSLQVKEKITGTPASDEINTPYILSGLEERTVTIDIPISGMQLWSPDNSFLYNLVARVEKGGTEIDNLTTAFGMREFEVIGSDFYLNGNRIFLKGSNIAFHRFLSDPQKGTLPWNEEWIKTALIDIPKEHNFNFFRNHLGQMYNKWYDIADEYGILIQNEWMFWEVTGTEEQIRQEFTQWLYDNWNHPSIIIWDAMNETESALLEETIIPEMKILDPTRPWEPIDFFEEHPYIYSLGPVLNDSKFGYSRSIEEIENSTTPTMLNEYIWWWLDKDGDPTFFTEHVIPRWLGKDSTTDQRLEHQAFLASELTELWRRIGVDGIAPFVYLSIEDHQTSNWFTGDIADLTPKPILGALKDALAPFGVSIELWDRHFFVDQIPPINIYVFNDYPVDKSGTLYSKIVDEDGVEVVDIGDYWVDVLASETLIQPIDWTMPSTAGTYYLQVELVPDGETTPVAKSKKVAHVSDVPIISSNLIDAKIMVYDPDNEITDYLTLIGLTNVINYDSAQLSQQDILILGEGSLQDSYYESRIPEITEFVQSGHSLVVIEPSYDITSYEGVEVSLLTEMSLVINKRVDEWTDGYDSYVFQKNPAFSLWDNIDEEHLKMFNGGWGGEMISQYDVELQERKLTLARSGHNLKYSNAVETTSGDGVVVVSRIQTRGRLTEDADPGTDLYSRRVDPVAQQYLLNLLSTYLDTPPNWQRIYDILKTMPLYVKEATASTDFTGYEPSKAIDGDFNTRWGSEYFDPQWITLDLGRNKDFTRVILYWETAYGKSYQIQISDDNINWTDIYSTTDGDGGIDEIPFDVKNARYIRMYGTERGTDYGYSLWEFEVYYDEVPVGSISGSVTLQGRADHSKLITFELRNPGETTPIVTYQPTNDEDPDTPGTQITTSSNGSFHLVNIPPGTYDLTAKASNFLRAKQSDVTVVAEETPDIDFSLLGGDCDGNNIVSLMDFSILRAAYGSSIGDPLWNEEVDFNGNGQIDLMDFSIFRSNYGKSGAQ